MSELQQRSRSIFLKCRAPCAAARSPVANGRPQPRDPPTAAPPALWGAAPPPSALDRPATLFHPAPQHRIAQAEFLGHRSDRAAARSHQIDRLPLIVVRKQPTLTVLPSNTSRLRATTGVRSNRRRSTYSFTRKSIGIAGDSPNQPFTPSAGLFEISRAHQRQERQGGVSGPAKAVVPVAPATHFFRKRRCRSRDNATCRRERQRL